MIREIDGGGSSHLSQNSSIAHFGLGSEIKVDSIKVTWVGGKTQFLTNQSANQLVTIIETEGQKKESNWEVYLLVIIGILGVLFLARKGLKVPLKK
jgi:hypothetical protein